MGNQGVNILSLENVLFRSYLFYSCILVLKVMFMVVLIGRHRFAKKIFISPEDAKLLKGSKAGVRDDDIERVRRAHRNDLENILIFFVAAFCYIMTNPSPALAVMLMRIFTVARIAHTIVYAVIVIPQPARAIAFFVGYFITAYMALMAILTFAA